MADIRPDQTGKDLEKPSKSQRKREALALQQLGARLVQVKPALLDKFPLSDELRDAVILARGLAPGSARKRQIQYIGKLLRQTDPAPIQAALADIKGLSLKNRSAE